MFCTECGKENVEAVQFCRHCGASLRSKPLVQRRRVDHVGPRARTRVPDPDELTSNGIGSVIMGDGFFMVSVILSATHTPVSSLLWLFLLIPAFIFFGKGFADVFHAKQIRRVQQLKSNRQQPEDLPPSSFSIIATLRESVSGDLSSVPSVTERTTRDLS